MATIDKIRKQLKRLNLNFDCREQDDVLILTGSSKDYETIVAAGHLCAHQGYHGVVNRIELIGFTPPPMKVPNFSDLQYDQIQTEVLIIGGGIIGCAIARELSKWKLKIMVLEKEYDVATQASSRNDGMIHPGIDLRPTQKKGMYNVLGNKMYAELSKQLNVPYERRGSYLVFDKPWHKIIMLHYLRYKSRINHIPMVKYVDKETLMKTERLLTPNNYGAAFFPHTGYISPYLTTVALAENAIQNGVLFALNTVAQSFIMKDHHIEAVVTNRGTIYPKIVINAAGVFADIVANYANDQFFTIHPRKGSIAILDKKAKDLTTNSVGAPFRELSRQHTKGGGIIRTVDNNILLGPDAVETLLREDTSTDKIRFDQLITKFQWLAPSLNKGDIITYFSGVRAATYEEDFIVEPSRKIDNFIYAAGIQSPGITAAPAIAIDIETMVLQKMNRLDKVEPNQSYNPYRKAIPHLADMPIAMREQYIQTNPDYGIIICRCEQISKGEIIDAIHSPLPATSIDAIKRRVRSGMGRCQGGFCVPLITQLLVQETNRSILDITKGKPGSNLLVAVTKEGANHE